MRDTAFLPRRLTGICFVVWLILAPAAFTNPDWSFHSFPLPVGKTWELFSGVVANDDGGVWVSIWGGGCARFYGTRWTVFETKNGLPTLSVRCIERDGANGVWVGTDRGLAHIAWPNQEIRTYNIDNTPAFSTNEIATLLLLRNGKLLVGLYDGKLIVMSPATDERRGANSPEHMAELLYDASSYGQIPRDMVEDTHGALWISLSSAGLLRYRDGQVECFNAQNSVIKSAKMLYVNREAHVFVSGGSWLYRYSDEVWTEITGAGQDPYSISSSPNGNMVVSSKTGLRVFRQWDWQTLDMGVMIGAPEIRGIDFGPEGLMWLITHEGLFVGIPPQWENFTHTAQKLGFSGQTFCVSPRLGPIATTQQNDIAFFDGEWNTFLRAPIQGILSTITLDAEDRLWILGKDTPQLIQISLPDGVLLQSWDTPKTIDPTGLHLTKDGQPWLMTKGSVYGRVDDQWRPLFQETRRKGEQVLAVSESQDASVYLCYEKGIECWKDGEVGYLEESFPELKGLRYTTIYHDREGKLWIGVEGQGLRVLHDNQFQKFTVRDGLASVQVATIYEATDGTIWISYLLKGLGSYRDGRWVNFTHHHGLPNGTFINFGEWPKGTIWTSTKAERLFRYTRDGAPPDTRILAAPEKVDSYGVGAFTFVGVDTWSVTRQEDLEYRWRVAPRKKRMRSADIPWSEWTKETTIRTPPLPAGEYVFEVRAIDESRNEDPASAQAVFIVEKPFYFQLAFLAPITILGLIVLILLRYLYVKHLRLIRSEGELKVSEGRLRHAQKIARVGNWEWIFAQDQIRWSDTACDIFGCEGTNPVTPRDILVDVTVEEDRPQLRQSLGRMVEDGTGFELEHRIKTLKNELRHVLHRAVSEMDSRGRPIRAVGTIHDITDIKRAEEERRLLEAEILRAEKMESLNTMAGSIAHHFNNLLMGILGYLEFAAEILAPRSPEATYVEEAQKAAQRAADLSKLMLIYVGHSRGERTQLDLNDIMRSVKHALDQSIWGDGVQLDTRFAQEPIWVSGDGSRLTQVAHNLISNAAEAIEATGGLVKVEVSRRFHPDGRRHSLSLGDDLPKGVYACLEVTDGGPGIDPEIMQRIFDPFFSTRLTGRGLGLGTALGIIRAHCGRIEVDSQSGCGSRFTVFLPLSPAE